MKRIKHIILSMIMSCCGIHSLGAYPDAPMPNMGFNPLLALAISGGLTAGWTTAAIIAFGSKKAIDVYVTKHSEKREEWAKTARFCGTLAKVGILPAAGIVLNAGLYTLNQKFFNFQNTHMVDQVLMLPYYVMSMLPAVAIAVIVQKIVDRNVG